MADTGFEPSINRWARYGLLQLMNVLFSIAGIFVKLASIQMQQKGFLSFATFSRIFCYVILLGVYAFFWQKVIKTVSLSTAYMSKSLLLFWSLLWANLLFRESITVFNLLGAAIIISGTLLVNSSE